MVELTSILLVELALICCLMTLLWGISVALTNASIVDIFWGLGFVAISATAFLWANPQGARPLLVVVLVSLWGVRLGGYLVWRNWGKGEDYRYRAMREQRPDSFWWWSLPCVFLLQGVLMWVVSLPLQASIVSAAPLNGLDVLGIGLWALGWGFESVGDTQLARFKARAENKGRVMSHGLWRYTRHPNYFGDFLVWWGFFVIALAGTGKWWTVISPLLMSWLLMRVSGVALLEKTISQRRPEYDDYIRRTSAFFPWPPRNG